MICSTLTSSARTLNSAIGTHLPGVRRFHGRTRSGPRSCCAGASDSEGAVDAHDDCDGPESHAGEQWSIVQQQFRGTSAAFLVMHKVQVPEDAITRHTNRRAETGRPNT